MNKKYSSKHLTFTMLKKLIESWEAIGMSDKQIVVMIKSLGTNKRKM